MRDRRHRDRMLVGLQLPTQSVPITTDVVSSNPDQGEVYNKIKKITINFCCITFFQPKYKLIV